MTYEEKLDLIVAEIVEARKRARAGQPAKIFVDKRSELLRFIILQEIYDILLKLQDDEEVIKVESHPAELDEKFMVELNPNNDHFLIEILDAFDKWLIRYRMRQKARPENIDWLNLLKVIDVCSDIEQRLQIARTNLVTIPSFPYPYIGRFLELFPYDTIGTRKVYQQHRWDGAQYLIKQKVDY